MALDSALFTLHYLPRVSSPSIVDLSTSAPLVATQSANPPVYTISRSIRCPTYSNTLLDGLTYTELGSVTANASSDKIKRIQLYNPDQDVQLKRQGNAFKVEYQFLWEGETFSIVREGTLGSTKPTFDVEIVRRPDPPIKVAMFRPETKKTPAFLQIFDYNISRCELVTDKRGLEQLLVLAVTSLLDADYDDKNKDPEHNIFMAMPGAAEPATQAAVPVASEPNEIWLTPLMESNQVVHHCLDLLRVGEIQQLTSSSSPAALRTGQGLELVTLKAVGDDMARKALGIAERVKVGFYRLPVAAKGTLWDGSTPEELYQYVREAQDSSTSSAKPETPPVEAIQPPPPTNGARPRIKLGSDVPSSGVQESPRRSEASNPSSKPPPPRPSGITVYLSKSRLEEFEAEQARKVRLREEEKGRALAERLHREMEAESSSRRPGQQQTQARPANGSTESSSASSAGTFLHRPMSPEESSGNNSETVSVKVRRWSRQVELERGIKDGSGRRRTAKDSPTSRRQEQRPERSHSGRPRTSARNNDQGRDDTDDDRSTTSSVPALAASGSSLPSDQSVMTFEAELRLHTKRTSVLDPDWAFTRPDVPADLPQRPRLLQPSDVSRTLGRSASLNPRLGTTTRSSPTASIDRRMLRQSSQIFKISPQTTGGKHAVTASSTTSEPKGRQRNSATALMSTAAVSPPGSSTSSLQSSSRRQQGSISERRQQQPQLSLSVALGTAQEMRDSGSSVPGPSSPLSPRLFSRTSVHRDDSVRSSIDGAGTRRTRGWSSLSGSSLSEEIVDHEPIAGIDKSRSLSSQRWNPALQLQSAPDRNTRRPLKDGQEVSPFMSSPRSSSSVESSQISQQGLQAPGVSALDLTPTLKATSRKGNRRRSGTTDGVSLSKASLESQASRSRRLQGHHLTLLDPMLTPTLASTTATYGKRSQQADRAGDPPPSPNLSALSLKSPLLGSIRSKTSKMKKMRDKEALPAEKTSSPKADSMTPPKQGRRAGLLDDFLTEQLQGKSNISRSSDFRLGHLLYTPHSQYH